jgi:hypothetical protein
LKALSRDGFVKIDGFNWQEMRSTQQQLPTPSLASRILCKRHNEALSGLDAMALRFFQILDSAIRQTEGRDRVALFDGTDFERWMLKTLCGAAFSANADIGDLPTDWRPDLLWLNILFRGEPFPERLGLYFAGETSDRIEGGFKLSTIANTSDGLYGVRIALDDELFLLLMDTPPEDLSRTYLARYLYRPKQIVLLNGDSENVFAFGWHDQFWHDIRVVKYEKT